MSTHHIPTLETFFPIHQGIAPPQQHKSFPYTTKDFYCHENPITVQCLSPIRKKKNGTNFASKMHDNTKQKEIIEEKNLITEGIATYNMKCFHIQSNC